MSVRRRSTPARVGAGVMLTAACILGPTAANAAPVGGLVPAEGSLCTTPSMAVSSTTVAPGESVTVTGNCFGSSAGVQLRVSGESAQTFTLTADSDGTVTHTFSLDAPGRFALHLVSQEDQSIYADSAVTVTESEQPEEPTDPEDPSDPEEPTDPAPEEPTDPDTEEPTDPEEPTEEEPTDPENPPEEEPPSEDPTSEGPDEETPTSEDPTSEEPDESNPTPEDESPSESPGQDERTSSAPEASGQATSPTKDFPGSNSPAPSASGQQPSSPKAGSDLPAAPETGTRDFPGSGKGKPQSPAAPQSLGALMLRIGEALTGLYGNSTEAPGADGTEPEASDGGGELAETGTEITAAATFAALAMGVGTGMLWLQRRRNEN